ncbi:MAG: phosphatidate cytidylyltransferase [Oscillospiraceae bacterium]|nr:phosphatidate cytidylyltransferase [Oscillospiraceae bacterium]
MKTRIIAAVALLPLLLLIVLAAPKVFTAILFGAMAAIGAYELLSGTGLVKHFRLNIYSMVMAFWCCLWCGLGLGYSWLLLGILLFWVGLMAEVMLSEMKLGFSKVALCFVAGLVLPMLLASLVRIHSWEKGRHLIFVPFMFAFLSDTGAYFAGLKFGKHKLAPVISPKKTVEGVVGGMAATVVGMLIYCVIMQYAFKMQPNYVFAVFYGLIGSVTSVFGDLCFSVVKRQTGIKDYGNLIPGHGGILDRFDSMMLAGPLAEVMLLLLPLMV